MADETADATNEPAILVVFGITGDLAQRYLLPAIYQLLETQSFHKDTVIIGVSRRNVSVNELFEQFQESFHESGEIIDETVMASLKQATQMLQMDLDAPEAYSDLLGQLNGIEDKIGACMNRLYYLSVPPQVYGNIIQLMGQEGLNGSCQHDNAATRLLVEKPFGYDLDSATKLLASTSEVFEENQIFRIDHFLAKQGVQNLLSFRLQNPELETIWDSTTISKIEVFASENIDIEGRVKFYEPLGALRDFIQNHLLQVLAIVTMDLPSGNNSEDIHRAKEELLKHVEAMPRSLVSTRAVRGQYKGYKEEVGNLGSTTETYAGITVFIGGSRWQDVPVSVWTGKALADKKYGVIVNFKDGGVLEMQIQPAQPYVFKASSDDSGMYGKLQLALKNFAKNHGLAEDKYPNAYEKVILDAISGNHSLFASREEVLNSWRIVQPVLDSWSQSSENLIIYGSGTPGPLTNRQLP